MYDNLCMVLSRIALSAYILTERSLNVLSMYTKAVVFAACIYIVECLHSASLDFEETQLTAFYMLPND